MNMSVANKRTICYVFIGCVNDEHVCSGIVIEGATRGWTLKIGRRTREKPMEQLMSWLGFVSLVKILVIGSMNPLAAS
jgi:hypothetical protein